MHSAGPSKTLFLVAFVLLAGLLVGCGGGDQPQNGSQDGGGGDAPASKIALGTIKRVKAEREVFFVRPSAEEQGAKPIRFKITRNARITLDGQEAKIEDIESGQQAQVEYVVTDKEVNRARTIELFSKGGGEETTG